MSSYKLITIFICLVFNSIIISGQTNEKNSYSRLVKFPVFNMNYRTYSNAKVDVKNMNPHYKVDEYNTAFQLAVPLKKKKTYLYNSIAYSYSKYSSDINYLSNDSHKFYTVNFNIGLIKVLPKNWLLSTNFIPKISSDFKEKLHSDDFTYNVSMLAQKRTNEKVEYGFGISYSSYVSITEGPFISPLFQLTYKSNKHILQMILPSHINYSYDLNTKTTVGMNIAVSGNISNTLMRSNYSPQLEMNRISEAGVSIGPEFQKKIWGDFYFNANAGITVGNRLLFQDNQLKTEVDVNVHQRFYLGLGIVLLK